MEVSAIEKCIGVVFKDKKLLIQAFTHRSYLNEHRDIPLESNERLEFLGDIVLSLIVTKHIFERFPKDDQGQLTEKRTTLVCGSSLTRAAQKMGIEKFLFLARGEARDNVPRARVRILEDTFEAIIGALYLDRGYTCAEEFIHRVLLSVCKENLEVVKDGKSKLQEKAQQKYSITPTYLCYSDRGPDHDKIFSVGVYLNTDLLAKGEGRTKKEAEQNAAEKAFLLL